MRRIIPRERRCNVYWSIRKAMGRKSMIGYAMVMTNNKYKKERFRFVYLGRFGAHFFNNIKKFKAKGLC